MARFWPRRCWRQQYANDSFYMEYRNWCGVATPIDHLVCVFRQVWLCVLHSLSNDAKRFRSFLPFVALLSVVATFIYRADVRFWEASTSQ